MFVKILFVDNKKLTAFYALLVSWFAELKDAQNPHNIFENNKNVVTIVVDVERWNVTLQVGKVFAYISGLGRLHHYVSVNSF